LHRQPDNVWRIDLQIGPEADAAIERQPERVRPRIERMLGHGAFEFEWISIYKFQCRRMQRFLHGRVIFAGDSAHQVSPFGARGANSGLEDGENLAWKLDLVLRGEANAALLSSYEIERGGAADDNIRASTRSTDFIAPHSKQERRLRQAVLSLAKEVDFAKRMVNAGRLSVPSVYDTPLSTPDGDEWSGGPPPGASLRDVPLETLTGAVTFLTDAFTATGRGFALLHAVNGGALQPPEGVAAISIGPQAELRDAQGLFAQRYDAPPGAAYLLRPDGYVAARFKHPTQAALAAALARASGRGSA
jgi:3-(3-hydroxy-phenyl)propionate hydroxylase